MSEFVKAYDSRCELASVLLKPYPTGNLGLFGCADNPPVTVGYLGTPMVGASDDASSQLPVGGGYVAIAVCTVADELCAFRNFINFAPASNSSVEVVFEGGSKEAGCCVVGCCTLCSVFSFHILWGLRVDLFESSCSWDIFPGVMPATRSGDLKYKKVKVECSMSTNWMQIYRIFRDLQRIWIGGLVPWKWNQS